MFYGLVRSARVVVRVRLQDELENTRLPADLLLCSDQGRQLALLYAPHALCVEICLVPTHTFSHGTARRKLVHSAFGSLCLAKPAEPNRRATVDTEDIDQANCIPSSVSLYLGWVLFSVRVDHCGRHAAR